MFDGEVTIENLSIENIFSFYSTLSTDIDFKGLDLEQLTEVFAFGKIEGSLDGKMHDPVLEDWQLSYFEAEFATPDDGDRPHRISQKSLENLNELGDGLSGTLSQGFVRFSPGYSYGQLSISCRLNNGIYKLGGVGQNKGGFYIRTRGGLIPPWVEVKGTGRLIQWDELLGGLKQIAEEEISFE